MSRNLCTPRLLAPSQLLRMAAQPPRRSFTQSCLISRPRAPQSRHAQHPQLRPDRLGFWRPNSTKSGDVDRRGRTHSEGGDVPAEEKGRFDQFETPRLRTEAQEDPRTVRPPVSKDNSVPAYELTFTCKPCLTRSGHRISKHGYHKGTVLITCPNCKNRHVISDHLKIFNDKSKSFEEILQEKSELLTTGELDANGDFELWSDGKKTPRTRDATGTSQADGTAAT